MRLTLSCALVCSLAPSSSPCHAGHVVCSDKDVLQGQWMAVAAQFDGKKSKLTDDELRMVKLIIKDDRFILRYPPGDVFGGAVATQREYTFVFDETKKPKTIDLVVKDKEDQGKKYLGIYSLDKNILRICLSENGKDRPEGFVTKRGSGYNVMEFKREKP